MSRSRRFQSATQQLDAERCRRDAQYFVFDSGLCTKDEHDVQAPAKPFPPTSYLPSLCDCLSVVSHLVAPEAARYALAAGHSADWLMRLSTGSMFAVEKSRQVMVTWLCAAWCLWLAKFHADRKSVV